MKQAVEMVSTHVEKALQSHWVVVVPGFFGTSADGAVMSLGRGGSDLTAVLLADQYDARCELIKDVPGYFTEDPNIDPSAKHLPWISHHVAKRMAESGCELVQPLALEAAQKCGLEI